MTAASSLQDGRPALGKSLTAAAAELRLPMSEQQSTQLLDFIELLAYWNRTYNLTAVRDPANMLTQHVVDCLAAVHALRREGPYRRVLDVGSGGGLPGVVWAVMEPGMDVTCIDSVGKKAAFLRQAASSLRLANLHGEHTRVESFAAAAPFDLITSRAFAALSDFVDMTAPLLSQGGVWMAMKGKIPTEEIEALSADVEVFHVEQVHVPRLDAERCLVWMRSTGAMSTSKDGVSAKSKRMPSESSGAEG